MATARRAGYLERARWSVSGTVGRSARCAQEVPRDVVNYDSSFIISRLRSTKSLCREVYVVGLDAVYAESVRLL